MCRNASGFWLHYQVYSSGRLQLLLSVWPVETKQKKIKQEELYRSHPLVLRIQLLLTYGKQIFPHLCGWCLVLITHLFPSVMHQHDKHNLHSSHGREKHFIQRRQKMLSVSWGGNQGVYAAVCGHAFRMMTQRQVRPQRRQQRKQKRLRDRPLNINCLQQKAASSLGTAKISTTFIFLFYFCFS